MKERKSNASYQQKFKSEMAQKGFRRKEVWVDQMGFTVNAKDKKDREHEMIDLNKMINGIKEKVAPMYEPQQKNTFDIIHNIMYNVKCR